MKKQLTIMALISALLAAGAYAAGSNDPMYLTIDESSIRIEALDDRGGAVPPGPGPIIINPPAPAPGQLPVPPSGPVINPPIGPGPGTGNTINEIDQIVNLAQKIWDIIKANAPVVNIAVNYANAVPYGTTHWTQLEGWGKPVTRRYAFSVKNGFGSQVVKVIYQVHWVPGGNLQGKGKFLTGVTVEPISVSAAWGYTVDLLAQVPDSTVANVGSREDPVASMQVQLGWKVSTAVKIIEQKAIYYVQGDGLMQELGIPFQRDIEIKTEEKIAGITERLKDVKFD